MTFFSFAATTRWGKRAAHNRAQIVYYMAENLELRRSEVASDLCQMTGQSMEDALREVDLSVQRLFYWGAYADKYGGSVQETLLYGATVKIHEPIGVIGIACPDVSPLLAFVSLFAPAVVRGNAVVVIPSEKYPTVALDFYQVCLTSLKICFLYSPKRMDIFAKSWLHFRQLLSLISKGK